MDHDEQNLQCDTNTTLSCPPIQPSKTAATKTSIFDLTFSSSIDSNNTQRCVCAPYKKERLSTSLQFVIIGVIVFFCSLLSSMMTLLFIVGVSQRSRRTRPRLRSKGQFCIIEHNLFTGIFNSFY